MGTKWAPLYGYLGIFGVGPTRVIPALNHQVYPASKNIWSVNILLSNYAKSFLTSALLIDGFKGNKQTKKLPSTCKGSHTFLPFNLKP